MSKKSKAVWEWKIVRRALWDSLIKLNPKKMMGNPVMFVVEIGSVITTVLLFKGGAALKFNLQITLWLWFTVLFANFAEAMAEGRGKAQADTFLDRMIALVEGAERQKTPNEIALNILLAGLTIIFLLAVVTLQPFAIYSGSPQTVFVLVSLLVCLIPTTIGGLLSAIGIAGMDRLIQHNVLAMSGRAVEAAGDVNTLLLDKTGTITLGNRQASRFVPAPGVTEKELADAAQLSSLADETPEGRSIVVLAKEKYGLRGRELGSHEAVFVPFSANTRMSGVNFDGRVIRKGAVDAIEKYLKENGSTLPKEVQSTVETIARSGGTPLVVAENNRALGVIHLKDIVKGGIGERFCQLRAMGIRPVMITGDNPLTAAAIAREAGVDDFLAQATPKDKMDLIRREQANAKLFAMPGTGTNEPPARAQ